MNLNRLGRGTRKMKFAQGLLGMTLAMALSASGGWAQTADTPAKPSETVQTFYLTNVSQQNDAREIQVAVSSLLPSSALAYFVPSQNAIVLRGTPDQLVIAQKVINDLDRPRKTYRLTYTITEMDGGKRLGTQHFAMVVVSGQRTTLKQGSKVPVVTGTYNPGTSSAQSQMTYLDVGINFAATLDESANGVRLQTKAEQSSIAEEKSTIGAQDPIVRQTVLEGTSILTPGKPLVLGSLDVPGSTRHLDLEVVMEVVR